MMKLISYGIDDLAVMPKYNVFNTKYNKIDREYKLGYNYSTNYSSNYSTIMEMYKYDSQEFIDKFIEYIDSTSNKYMGTTLYQCLILEMADLIDIRYWKQNNFYKVCLKLIVSKNLPNQLTKLLLEDVMIIYNQRKLDKTHMLCYDLILSKRSPIPISVKWS